MAGVATVRAGATTGEVASEEATWGMVRLAAEAKAEAVLCVAEPVREMEAKAEKAKAAVVQVEVALVAAEMGASKVVARVMVAVVRAKAGVARVAEERRARAAVASGAAWARAAAATRAAHGSRSPRSPSQNRSAHSPTPVRRRHNCHPRHTRVLRCTRWSKRPEEAGRRWKRRAAMVAARAVATV